MKLKKQLLWTNIYNDLADLIFISVILYLQSLQWELIGNEKCVICPGLPCEMWIFAGQWFLWYRWELERGDNNFIIML